MSIEFGVYDRNVKPGQERTHSMPNDDGTTSYYTFKHNLQTSVPQRHAVRFQRIPSFEVRHPRGDVLPLIPSEHPLQVKPNQVKLKDGQTVAALEELTQAALYSRALLFPGGSKLKSNASRDSILKFLKGLAPNADRLGNAGDLGEDDPELAMSGDELGELLDGKFGDD